MPLMPVCFALPTCFQAVTTEASASSRFGSSESGSSARMEVLVATAEALKVEGLCEFVSLSLMLPVRSC